MIIRSLLKTTLLCSFLVLLASCGKNEHSPANVRLLSTNVHVSIAQRSLVLPFIALDDYAYRKQSFSLDRKGDNKRAQTELSQFLHDSADPQRPLARDSLSVRVRTYGWNDVDMRQIQVCPLLTREWARSVCDNPWAVIQQALPDGRFKLVDLSRLHVGDPRGPANCRDDGKPHRPLPENAKEVAIVCSAQVYGGRDDQYHRAVVRIDGDLGALWTVWRYGRNGETAEAMAEREGRAIVAFVQYAIGQSENFSKLQAAMCHLRRPGSLDGPHGADCRLAAK